MATFVVIALAVILVGVFVASVISYRRRDF